MAGSLATIALLYPVRRHASLYLVLTMAYCVLVLCLTKRIPVCCPVSFWLGSHLFQIYILMRIPMIILKKYMWQVFPNALVFVVVSLMVTLCLAHYYKKILP